MKTETENKSVCIFRPIAKRYLCIGGKLMCQYVHFSSPQASSSHTTSTVQLKCITIWQSIIMVQLAFLQISKLRRRWENDERGRRQWDRDEFGVAQMNNRRMIMESWHNCHCLPEIENCPLCLVQETRSLFIIRSRHISPKTDPRFSGKRQARNTTSCVISGSKVHPSVCVCVYLRMFGDVSW